MTRLLLPTLLLLACGKDKSAEETDESSAGGSSVEVYPPVGGQGVSLDLDLDATSSLFQFGSTGLDLGEGVTVESVDVEDGWGARARITIDPEAELGPRDAIITSGDRVIELNDAFEVISQSFMISPDEGLIGETIEIDMIGNNTAWTGGVTWPNFGDGVVVNDFSVLSESLAVATVSVDLEATPGWRNVVMDNGGGDLVTLYEGFKVDRAALAARFDPILAEQGDTVEFTIFARGTDFLSGDPELTFLDRYGDNPDIVVDSLTVLDAENLYGQMTLSNAAALGMRDVLVQTGDEGVLIPDAFEVVSGGWDLSEVAIDLSFTVVRVRDDATGAISESVSASCVFFIPLDPPCPTGGGSGSGSGSLGDPEPYDVNGVWGVTGEGSSSPEDCPFPTTIPAGDYVWLESDANTITMVKNIDPSTGVIFYTAEDLTFADYVTDNWYDLHTQGEEGGIGEYLLEDVQPTVPSDWQWVAPELWGGYTHSRAEDFEFQWTPAMTYPDAMFVVSLFTKTDLGPFEEEGWAGYAAVLPWDDGEHYFTSDEISNFAAGTVPVHSYSFIAGPEFGLPESIYQDNVAVSYIYLLQSMVLE